MTNPLLEVLDLNVFYGSAHILQGVRLAVGNEPVALLGRNGMGKTTLCKALMGLVPVTNGDIVFEGNSIKDRKPYQIASAGIGYVPQGRRIFPSLTVHEHLQLLSGRGKNSSQRWTQEGIYELFPRLAERRKSGAGTLSGGEQQMLAIGRALLTNARLLIMDEPSEGLAPAIVDHLLETLHRLSNEGIAMLVVEQKLNVATALAERVLIMVSGRVVHESDPATLLADEEAKQRYLGVN